jgi:tetratricopeptide (TPR) repeat protein
VEGVSEAEELAALRGPDAARAARAAAALWQRWHQAGDPALDAMMRDGIAAMERQDFGEAETIFSRLIRVAPDFAEGWNKRATVHYLAGDYRKSLADCAEVVKRNPSHFGALSGYGQVYFQLEEYDQAIRWWKRALEVNPNMAGVEINIKGTEELVKKKRGRAI